MIAEENLIDKIPDNTKQTITIFQEEIRKESSTQIKDASCPAFLPLSAFVCLSCICPCFIPCWSPLCLCS